MRAAAQLGLQVSVRRFAPEDAAFVAELSERAFGEYGAHPARYTLSVIEHPDTRSWLAVEAGVPLGLVVLELNERRAAILAVAVTERARGRGIGGLLMQVAERHAQAQGARQLSLCTADANLAALDLFLRRGFRIVRRKPGFYSRRQDACELEKTLIEPAAR
jgi:[ribosomal protein S18]-alanine N-acetyltransferase